MPGDRLCIPVPLYHCFGMVMGNLGCLTHGATMVYPARPRVAGGAGDQWRRKMHRPLRRADHVHRRDPRFAEFDLASLRTGIMAGSPCPIEVMKRVIGKMNMAEVTIAYGMTETSPVSFQSGTDDPIERRVSPSAASSPIREVKIVDNDRPHRAARPVRRVCTRGYSVMLGYWDDEAPEGRRSTPAAGCTPATSGDRRRGLLQHRRPHQRTW